jgi:DNA-binding transcriptional LysR family regulator
MRDLDLKSLRLFVAACERGNIRQAAVEAHIEPSAISKRIAQLEDSLGTQLLERSRRGVAPTPAGQALLEHARTLLFTLGRIEADAAAFSSGVQGQVRLVASASAIAEHLLDDIAAFLREPAHRAIQVDIEERHSADVVRFVRDGNAALGICWDQLDAGPLECLPYRHDELVLAVPPDHPLASRSSISYSETLDHDQVGMPPWSAVTRTLEQDAARAGRRVAWRVVVSNFDAAFRVVVAGLAISVLPAQVGAIYRKQFGLCLIPIDEVWAQRRFAVICRDQSALPPPARRMLDHLLAGAALAGGLRGSGAHPA